MIDPQWVLILATIAGLTGMWLLLSRGGPLGRWTGAVLLASAAGLFASRLPRLDALSDQMVLTVLSGITVVAAVATVTLRSPVYCAIWFGMTLLGTSGLFLLCGAQFLAAATIVVYAGAILVTFLFVLMLAQPEGRAVYDRVAWEGLISAATGVVFIGVLSMIAANALADGGDGTLAAAADAAGDRSQNVLGTPHVARIGMELFSRHLIAVEVAGTLLLAALVGAGVIIANSRGDPS